MSAVSGHAAAEEMHDPQKDVPKSVTLGAVITVLCYGIPIFGILEVLPASKISGIAGFLDAIHTTFSVYGGAQNFLVDVMALGFIFALVTSGSVWMMGSDRIQAAAAYDGAFIGWFGRFNAFFGTPVRVNVMSAANQPPTPAQATHPPSPRPPPARSPAACPPDPNTSGAANRPAASSAASSQPNPQRPQHQTAGF